MEVFGYQDLLIGPIVLIALLIHTYFRQQKKLPRDPSYKYFSKAFLFSLAGTTGFILIYTFYYPGGDTHDFYEESVKLSQLYRKNPLEYFETLYARNEHTRSFFNNQTGFPKGRYWDDRSTYNMVRFLSVLQMIFFKSYVAISVFLSYLSFMGCWLIYKIFYAYYPQEKKWWFYSILCFPSTLFWASGINKESVTIFLFGLTIYSFFALLNRKKIKSFIFLLLGLWGLLSIKSYIVVALLPTLAVWITRDRVSRVKNRLARVILTPTLLIVFMGGSIIIYGTLGDYLGSYGSIDSIVTEASIRQHDLKQDYYRGNAFDIGDYETSVNGIISVSPQAILAGLYRPFPWEVSKIVDGLSGMENLILILLSIFAVFYIRNTLQIISRNPFILFSLIFSLIFAFSIGISTSNFGALVRFKVIMLPLLVPALVSFSIIKSRKS
jgi:hypothetical protein